MSGNRAREVRPGAGDEALLLRPTVLSRVHPLLREPWNDAAVQHAAVSLLDGPFALVV